MLGSKTEYDKFKDADASYQHREGYKIVIEPTSRGLGVTWRAN